MGQGIYLLSAGARAGKATVTAISNLGILTRTFTVVEPTSETATKVKDLGYPEGTQGAGMNLEVTVQPKDVSFYNVQMREVDLGTTGVTGVFQNMNPSRLIHEPNPNWINLSKDNKWTDNAEFFGFVKSEWGEGKYEWPIGVEWRVGTKGVPRTLPTTRHQIHTMLDSSGSSKISKSFGTTPALETTRKLPLLPIDLATDLNNDGQITSADSSLREAAIKSGASDDAKEKGTEYLFINDKMSNGVWDADDDGVMSYSYGPGYSTMPKPPATHKDDDDAQALKVSVGGLNTGVVWFDHSTIDKLEFFKTKECKAGDKLNITASSPFNLSTGSLPETIYMRLRDDWAGVDSEGTLRMFVGKTVNETWAELKLPLTVVRDFGAKHFFHAARDYILENNSRVCIRDHGYPFGPNPSVIFRLCMMREEATKMTAFDAKAGGTTGIEAAYYALPAVPRIPAVIINGNQCFWSAGWDEENPFDLPNMLGNIADKCHGRVIRGSVTAATSSDNFDPTTKPAAGSVLAGPDPIPAGTIAGPDGITGTADDITNPDAGDPGGKYVGYNSGAWTFAAGRAGGSDALGGLSTNYGSAQRANKAHQLMGFAKGVETGKGCIFTATQIKGVGYGTIVKGDASSAGVPALSPSADAGAIKLFILDSGAGSLALMHIDPAGTMRGAYLGRKTNWGAPYYVNNYLALDPAPARP